MSDPQKENFISSVRQLADASSELVDRVRKALAVYQRMEYNAGAASEITDADLENQEPLTAAKFHTAMAVFAAVDASLDDAALAAIYKITISPKV